MRYYFAGYTLDVEQRQLAYGVEPVAIQPQVFDLLVYLIRNRDRVVSKDDLIHAVWDGRIVSDSTLASRISAARRAIGDGGAAQRLIRTLPRHGTRFIAEVVEETDGVRPPSVAADNGNEPVFALDRRPSIAVLPFANLSGEPEQDYFADGIVEELITELARNPTLLVIARNSTFVYKGQPIDIRRVGRELGVHYVLEGSVRRAGERLRIAGQLIDASNGAHIWADRFEGSLADVFELQDLVTESVVGAVEPRVRAAEIRRAQTKPTQSLEAYDFVLHAMDAFNGFRLADALKFSHQAIAADPRYSTAYAVGAQCIAWRKTLNLDGVLVDDEEVADGMRDATLAVEFGSGDPTALWMAGQAIALLSHDYDRALTLIDRALGFCPNLAPALNASGWTRWNIGDGERAISDFERAIRLSPIDPYTFLFRSGIGWAHFVEGRDGQALEWSERALSLQPKCVTSLRCKVAVLGLLGRADEARAAVRALIALQPDATVRGLECLVPLRDARHMDRFLDGLRKAGLPE